MMHWPIGKVQRWAASILPLFVLGPSVHYNRYHSLE